MRTTSQLLADVRRQLMLPNTATLGLQDADILYAADMEMQSRLLPTILSINEEYGVQTVDIPLVAGQTQYRMPSRGAGSKLRDVRIIVGNVMSPLRRLYIEQLSDFSISAKGTPMGFWLAAGSINLVPAPAVGVLRLRFYQQHGKYVVWDGSNTSTAARLSSVVGYSQTVAQMDTIEFTVPTFTPVLNNLYDLIASSTPYEFLAMSASCTDAVSPYKLTVPVPAPSLQTQNLSPNVQAGDIICKAGEVPVVQLPDEAYEMLVSRICVAISMQVGDSERAAAFDTFYEKQKKDYLKMFAPRVDGSPKKLLGLQQSGYNRGNWWYR